MARGVRKLSFSLEEQLARRIAARAADLDTDTVAVVREQLDAWLGGWGLRTARHVVRAGETLPILATRYYRDPSKHTVIALYNGLTTLANLKVGQELLIPEPLEEEPLPKGSSPYLFGMHDRGAEHYMGWAGHKGWVLVTEELGANRTDWSSRAYDDLTDNGYGVIVRLNHGYGPAGTLPRSERYRDFGVRCGNFVERSRGCHIWVIANEPNLAVERAGGPVNGEAITPERYAQAYALCREEIHRRPGHEDDQVVTAAVGPWNVQTAYPSNVTGDWITYFRDML
ncbi:MAG: LysM peptidoglycan-binding domain-containing protein, partial [Chloroflexi bacterium]|nr:LysM peptidoglycan-binding domain-containing protein [Chloroflexota bacterium]